MLNVTSSFRGLRVKAPAKVNLTLRVLGTRPDGYHALESLVAGVSLFDTLAVEPADDLVLTCDGVGVPAGEDNLVLRAARAVQEVCGGQRGARLHLCKRIPVGRGFGGGSSNAAAALVALNRLWGCGLGSDGLMELGASVGSDVPVFLGRPLAIVRGRGEEVEPVEARCGWRLVLAWPDYMMPTAQVYAAYDRLRKPPNGGPSATDILPRLPGPARAAAPFVINDLEAAADNIRGDRLDLRDCLCQAGAGTVGMTGSGSAYFAVADGDAQARRWAEAARAAGAKACVAELLVDGIEQRETAP